MSRWKELRVDGWQWLSSLQQKILTCHFWVSVANVQIITLPRHHCGINPKLVNLQCPWMRLISLEACNFGEFLIAAEEKETSHAGKPASAGQAGEWKRKGNRDGMVFLFLLMFFFILSIFSYRCISIHRACHIQYHPNILHNYYFQESLGSHRRKHKWQAFKMVFKSCGITRAFQK